MKIVDRLKKDVVVRLDGDREADVGLEQARQADRQTEREKNRERGRQKCRDRDRERKKFFSVGLSIPRKSKFLFLAHR